MKATLLSYFNENRRLILSLAAILAVNLVLRLGAARLDAAVQLLAAEYEAGELKLAETHADWERESEFRSALERAERRVARLHKETLQTRKIRFADIDRELKGLAKKFKLAPTSIKNTAEDLPDFGVEGFSTAFPLKGSYENLRRFISHIEGSEQFFIIEKVTLTDSTKKGAELNLQISVATYLELRPLAVKAKNRGGV